MSYRTNFSVKPQVNHMGASLIEAMVAVFISAIGMLGVLSMQVRSMHYSQSSYTYSQAAHFASDILESMRGNTSVLQSYFLGMHDQALEPDVNCMSDNIACTPEQLKTQDLYQWRKNIEAALLGGKSSIEVLGNYISITIQFDDGQMPGMKKLNHPHYKEYVLVTEIH